MWYYVESGFYLAIVAFYLAIVARLNSMKYCRKQKVNIDTYSQHNYTATR
jgi:hypothetical protein